MARAREDVDLACVVLDADDDVYYRSRRAPWALRRARDGATVCERRAAITCARATAPGRIAVGDADGYLAVVVVGDDGATSTTVETRIDVQAVTSIGAGMGYASTKERVVEMWTSNAALAPRRRWTLPRLAPLVAAEGRERDSDGSVTIIAVGGAAVALTMAEPMVRESARLASTTTSFFRRAASTALSVVKSVVEPNAELGENAVAYEGEDMEAVSSLPRERTTWIHAFVDAPRRYGAFEFARALDVFAVADVARHRVLVFRLIGARSIRLISTIKGCRGATFAFDVERRALVIHRPSVRVVEARRLRDPLEDVVEVIRDAADVLRVIPADVGPDRVPRVLIRDESGAVRARRVDF